MEYPRCGRPNTEQKILHRFEIVHSFLTRRSIRRQSFNATLRSIIHFRSDVSLCKTIWIISSNVKARDSLFPVNFQLTARCVTRFFFSFSCGNSQTRIQSETNDHPRKGNNENFCQNIATDETSE